MFTTLETSSPKMKLDNETMTPIGGDVGGRRGSSPTDEHIQLGRPTIITVANSNHQHLQ